MMNDKQIKEYFEKLDENIKNREYQLTYISASNSPAFCYSTGIYKAFNIPEIFISSLPQGLCLEIAEKYIRVFKENKAIPLNKRLEFLTSSFSIYLIDVSISKLNEYVLSSIRFYGNEDYKYLQVIYPDTNGNSPNDAGYDYDQEIIGDFKS